MAEPADKRVFIHTVDADGNITARKRECKLVREKIRG